MIAFEYQSSYCFIEANAMNRRHGLFIVLLMQLIIQRFSVLTPSHPFFRQSSANVFETFPLDVALIPMKVNSAMPISLVVSEVNETKSSKFRKFHAESQYSNDVTRDT